ncbi:Protein of unknown function [Escherichia coli D6-117.29]|nr:Protein of unknown function [Escherichia coli D6-117.29]
MMRAFLLI